jgi:hypothetical protein
MSSSFSTTTAAALGDAEGASDASVDGAVDGAAAVEAEGDAPGPQAARNAALADSPLAHRKPRRLSGVCAILLMI